MIKLQKNCISSRLPWEEATAPKGAAAHSLGTTGIDICNVQYYYNNKSSMCLRQIWPQGFYAHKGSTLFLPVKTHGQGSCYHNDKNGHYREALLITFHCHKVPCHAFSPKTPLLPLNLPSSLWSRRITEADILVH